MAVKAKAVEEMLKNIGLIRAGDIEEALRSQRETKERLGLILLRKGVIANENITDVVIAQLGISLVSLQAKIVEQDVVSRVPLTFAHHHRAVPISQNNGVLTLATDNPFNFSALGNFKLFLGFPVEAVLSTTVDVDEFLDKYYGMKDGAVIDTVMKDMGRHDKLAFHDMQEQEEGILEEDTAPVVKLVNLLIAEAFNKRASDIHIEPLENKFRIRYRIDGILVEMPGPPKRLQGAVISRVKIMAGMDIAEKRMPQDGRIRVQVGARGLDLRVSTLPALYGESVVLRILDKSSYMMGLDELGFSPDDEKKFKKIVRLPHGIFLVTGPTGSGKTTTLYGALHYINKPDRKLITIEDPVEYQITGVNQVQVRPQINLTFAAGLRSILRQAPDVIMVGEIRDFETAQIAIQASLTGHMVFSTLHTNDAPGALTRLIDMSIKPYLVASAVQAIMAQRLVRVICKNCKMEYEPTGVDISMLRSAKPLPNNAKFYKGKGCGECSQTGYRGRIAIFELLIIQDKLREMVFDNRPANELKKKARELGMHTLREDGIRKALKGVTTISEVIRITQQDID